MRAVSIRQPYAEQILRGTKKIEYRGRRTSVIGERFYIYASLTPGKAKDFESMGLRPGDLPTGVLVGTVEIGKCTGKPDDYKWHLKGPKRLKRNLSPRKHPQPVWFNPF
jgi:ASCH domain